MLEHFKLADLLRDFGSFQNGGDIFQNGGNFQDGEFSKHAGF